jgi:peptidoglycan/LPS O-acetylase OafA/YrhL
MLEEKKQRDQQLDVMRGIAIICVVAIHTAQVATIALDSSDYQFSLVDQMFRTIAEFGKYGVELFFFVSGVLLAKIYGNKPNFSISGFAARRFGRILPLWYFFALSSFLLYLLIDMGWWKGLLVESGGGAFGQFLVGVSTLFFLTWAIFPETMQRAIPGGWSIESEMTHYALFPFFRNLSSTKLIYTIALCGFLAAFNDFSLANMSILYEISIRLESLSIFTTLPFFLFGLLFVRLERERTLPHLTWGHLAPGLLSASGILMLLLNQVPFGGFAEALGFCILTFGVSLVLKKSRTIANSLVAVGKYSYFTYFFHFYVVSAIVHFQAEITANFLFRAIIELPAAFLVLHLVYFSIAILMSQSLGSISFRYFENPILIRARTLK